MITSAKSKQSRRIYTFFLIATILFLVVFIWKVCRFAKVQVLDESEYSITVAFRTLLPLHNAHVYLEIASADPRQQLTYELMEKEDPFQVVVKITELRTPTGFPLTILFTGQTLLPGLKLRASKTITRKVKPKVVIPPPEKIGTSQAVVLSFNTPIDEISLQHSLNADFEYVLQPRKVILEGVTFTDTTTWLLTPRKPLVHNRTYQVSLDETLESIGKIAIGKKHLWMITTVPPLFIASVQPTNGAQHIPVNAIVEAQVNRKPKTYSVKINGVHSEPVAVINNNRISFHFPRVFLPDTKYEIQLSIVDEYGEKANQTLQFTTAAMGSKKWIEVSLWLPNQVRVYHGKTLIKQMIASAGAPDTPTPRGWYRINGRGYAFYSYRYQEGAYYWVRFIGNYLFHSIPFDFRRQLKQSEQEKLGTPASHGCVRLAITDAKWIYDNIPDGSIVVIHGPPQATSSITTNLDETMVFLSNDKELGHFLKE